MTLKEIKGNARENLLPFLGISATTVLIASIIQTVIASIASLPITGTGFLTFFTYEAGFIISSLLGGIIHVGICKYFLALITEKKVAPFDVLHGFRHSPDKILSVNIFMTFIEVICLLPYAVYSCFFANAADRQSVLISLSIFLLCEAIAFLILLPFSLTSFILVDMPDLSAAKTIKMSCYLMKKHYFKLIGLYLSFIPLSLASLITFGIGDIWLKPYIHSCFAEFYLTVTEQKTI